MTNDNSRPELHGVGGWLGFLVIVLGILSPARSIFQSVGNIREAAILGPILGPNTPTYIQFSWGLLAVSVASSIFLAYRLLAVHRWSSVGITIVGLWCLALLPVLIDAVVGSVLFPKFAGSMIPEALWSAIKSSIPATIWTAYLVKSKRVANTYTKDTDETQRVFG